ncbi:MAG: DUF2807 domain-containing protein [Anaerolineales bacterium]|nr:DUF2807 domain-containing protein [Anaerolineales bacterium]
MNRKFSLFGPLLLIATGVMWLLIQQGLVPAANLWALTYLWPFLLIAAGLSLILRSYWKYSSLVLDVVLVGGAFAAVLYAGQLGWANMPPYVLSGGSHFGPGRPGSGKVITATREVFNFHGINVEYPAEIVIQQGSAESLKIEAEDNVIKDLRTDVKDGMLTIDRGNDRDLWVRPTKPIKITIVVKDLDEFNFDSAGIVKFKSLKSDSLDLNINGAGTLTLDDVQFKTLNCTLDGAGTLTLSGTAEVLNVDMSGFGDFRAADLQTQIADISIDGAGSATVWAEKSLIAEISGAGSINYYGSPTVTKSVDGVGSIKSLGKK